MKQVIMKSYSLLVLYLINISVGCQTKVDKQLADDNVYPYDNYKRTHIDTPKAEPITDGENDQESGDTESQQQYWDTDSETDCPYKGYDSSSGVTGGSSKYYGNIAAPQGKVHIHHFTQDPGHIHTHHSSDYNAGVGDNGRLINYNKIIAYPSKGYSASGSYNGGHTKNDYDHHYLGYSKGAGEFDQFSKYDIGKLHKSGGYFNRQSGRLGGMSWLLPGRGKKVQYPSNDKSKPYASEEYRVKETNVVGKGLRPNFYELNYHEGDNGKWSAYNKGKPYQFDDHYTRVGPYNNSFPEVSAESQYDDINNIHSRYQGAKKHKHTGSFHNLFDELYNKYSGSKIKAKPDVNTRSSYGVRVGSNEYEDLPHPICSQCQAYQDFTYPKSRGLLRQRYSFGLG